MFALFHEKIIEQTEEIVSVSITKKSEYVEERDRSPDYVVFSCCVVTKNKKGEIKDYYGTGFSPWKAQKNAFNEILKYD